MPSPIEDRPGLLIRDPFQYSNATLIIPPALVQSLRCFDGQQSDLDLRASITRSTGELQSGEVATHLCDVLDQAGFLANERFDSMRADRHREFASSPRREPAHCGSAYPDEPDELHGLLQQYMENAAPPESSPCGIAAPHVSPEGGWRCYRDAYGAFGRTQPDDCTFVVLGTSHYGQPDRFGLTRKPYVTPFGETQTDEAAIGHLAGLAPGAIVDEDYCHAVEHSIEFQILFLQYLFGPQVRVLPVLCGSFARSIYEGGLPEQDGHVQRFFEALRELAERRGNSLRWVLGIDMAHMGRRYGDPWAAHAHDGRMLEIESRDRSRIDALIAADARGFWERVRENHDDLKWCGSSPVYTFLKAMPQARGHLRNYEQWNIDEESVVTFAAIEFKL